VDEVASVSVGTKTVLEKASANLGLVFAVGLVVLLEFLQSVCELASLFVGAVSLFDELFAEL
jgi:uncharacterized membrane protein